MNSLETAPVADPDQELTDIERIAEEIDKRRIDPASFKGVEGFTDAEIEADLAYCENAHEKFTTATSDQHETSQREKGVTAEYAFRTAIERCGWIAPEVEVLIPSRYDDYTNGVDAILQIPVENEASKFVGLALDFGPGKGVAEKIATIFAKLDVGETAHVKYFDSDETGKRKDVPVPRLVVGGDDRTQRRLADYTMEILSGSKIQDEIAEEIRDDPFRHVFFGEMILELEVFCRRLKLTIEFSRRDKKKEIEAKATEALRIHEEALRTIEALASDAQITKADMVQHIRFDAFATELLKALY